MQGTLIKAFGILPAPPQVPLSITGFIVDVLTIDELLFTAVLEVDRGTLRLKYTVVCLAPVAGKNVVYFSPCTRDCEKKNTKRHTSVSDLVWGSI